MYEKYMTAWCEHCNTAGRAKNESGAIAQLGERLLCKQEVGGSNPPGSTKREEFWLTGRLCRLALLFNKLESRKRRQINRKVYLFGYVCIRKVNQCLNKSSDCLRLYGQATKRIWWMPRRQQAMKDVAVCDKPRGADKQALIRGFPNGETRPASVGHRYLNP